MNEPAASPRMLVHHNGAELCDGEGKPLGKLPRHKRGIGYFFLPRSTEQKPEAQELLLLTRLLRLAWTLAAIAQRGLKFKLVAAPATLRWFEASERSVSSLRLAERDAIFDLLPELLEDRALDNTLSVHADLLATGSDDKTPQWFTPAWRLPYRNRTSDGTAREWLWTTASFCGLPGSLPGPDLTAALRRTVLYRSSEEAGTPRPLRESVPAVATPVTRRVPARIAARRPIFCRLDVPEEGRSKKPKPWPAYLLDYSPVGCRVQIPASSASEAEQLVKKFRAALKPGTAQLVVPDGLYWPWHSNGTPCPLNARGRGVQIREDNWVSPSDALRDPLLGEHDLVVRLLYAPAPTAKPAS